MFRIDIQPHTTPHPQIKPPPLHACLATSKKNDEKNDEKNSHKSTLLTVGRKKCDITFENDKCVSRQHCRIDIITLSREQNTPEEKKACESSELGIILSIEDLGSKFGTFVTFPSSPPTTNHSDSETDDGETTPPPTTTTTQKRKIPPKSPTILPLPAPLSTTTLHLGISGSTITLTRLPLHVTSSRLPPSLLSPLLPLLPRIGATFSQQWDSEKSTHLICQTKANTAKNLSAWACRRPCVTVDWVKAMLGRREAGEELPKEEDYEPEGVDVGSGGEGERREVWRGIGMVSFVEDEMESLFQCGGAEVVKGHAMDDEEFFGGAWWEELVKKVEGRVVMMEATGSSSSSIKRLKKRRGFLTKRGVRVTTPKLAAMSLSQSRALVDTEGTEIGGGRKASEDQQREEDGVAEETMSGVKRPSSDDVNDKTMDESDKNHDKQQQQQQQDEEVPDITVLPSQPPPKKQRTNDKNDTTIITVVSTSSQPKTSDPIPPPTKKRQFPRSSRKGWLSTTPKTTSTDNSNNNTTLPPPSSPSSTPNPTPAAAITETRSDLILIIPPPSSSLAPSSQNKSNKPNYKRFKKNSIISNHGYDPLALESVLPKESARRQELELSQREMEREQRRADELFADVSGGGGMRNYVTGGAGKRRTGRRR